MSPKENSQRLNKTESGINLDASDELLKDFREPEAIMRRIEQLTKVVVLERARGGDLTHHPWLCQRRVTKGIE